MPDRYAHDPDAFDGDEYAPNGAENPGSTPDEVAHGDDADPESHDTDAAAGAPEAAVPEAVDREFDWRGWILVGVIVFAFLIAPATIVLLPPADYLFALLILPLAPAVLLALTAVWATVRP